MIFRRDIAKYLRYPFERKSFRSDIWPAISSQAQSSAGIARNNQFKPSIIIHGIMPRSGTVYLGELLRLHPSLFAYPNEIWEFPFLQQSGHVLKVEEEFLWAHEQNFGKIGEYDFLPLYGSSLIGYLHQYTPKDKQVVLKVPSVQYLSLFYALFPHENLIILIRDGRDIVHSTVKTWPQIRFWMVCLRWRRAARVVLACQKAFAKQGKKFMVAQFEEAVLEPEEFIRRACSLFDLPVEDYPFDRIQEIPTRGSSSIHQRESITWQPKEKPPDFQPIGHWKSWGPYRRFIFKNIAGKELIELGYEDDLQW